MRGIEAACKAWRAAGEGEFLSEALRKITASVQDEERELAATLSYAAMRRRSLWVHLVKKCLRKPFEDLSPEAKDILVVGTAGMFELKHFALPSLANALVSIAKMKCPSEAGLVNAVLRRVSEVGKREMMRLEASAELADQALLSGMPLWLAKMWADELGILAAKKLLKMTNMRSYLSLRLSPSAQAESVIASFASIGRKVWHSPLFSYSLRTAFTAHPPSLPSYREGLWTPQSESSMAAIDVASRFWKGGRVLDMCAGRGVKMGQMLQRWDGVCVEGWDVSFAKVRAAGEELERLGVPGSAFKLKTGDALYLEPEEAPHLIILDAPCSGSGTWGRHPEGKWRLTRRRLGEIAALQKRLLDRALSLLPPGGTVVYITCSLLRAENEQVVGDIMTSRSDAVELEVIQEGLPLRRGRPWGYYILPTLPWLDGFYIVIIMKR